MEMRQPIITLHRMQRFFFHAWVYIHMYNASEDIQLYALIHSSDGSP